ncbi:MAG: hypothetical protein FK733_19615 [Asgard group archaeon]|nr:hypothetical protein [Asgard group archaeon]
MKRYRKTNRIFVILFIAIFASTSILTLVSGNISIVRVKDTDNRLNSGVTIYSLADDYVIRSGVEELVKDLESYTSITIDDVADMDSLEIQLDNNPDDYVVFIGHSTIDGIEINKEQVDWSAFADFASEHKDKTIILPTCYSAYIYLNDEEPATNVIAPFKKEVDYRVSADMTMLALSINSGDQEMFDNSLDALTNNIKYIVNPTETLIALPFIGTYRQPGEGYTDIYNIFHDNYNVEEFILEASVRFAVHTVLEWIVLGPHIPYGAIALFLAELHQYYENINRFIYFFNHVVRNYIFDYMYDEGTTISYNILYEWPACVFFYYYYTYSVTDFTMYSQKYDITPYEYKRKVWKVDMAVEILNLLGFHVGTWEFALFATKTITWNLESYSIRVYPLGGRPGGGVIR